mgnify:CR=1 FL=1
MLKKSEKYSKDRQTHSTAQYCIDEAKEKIDYLEKSNSNHERLKALKAKHDKVTQNIKEAQ